MPKFWHPSHKEIRGFVAIIIAHKTLSADSRKSLLSELSNALLRSIAQHGQVESIKQPAIEPTVNPPSIPIDIESELIAINSTICQLIYNPS